MTNTTVEVDVQSAVWPVRGNQTLAELVHAEFARVRMPEWSQDEDELARRLQEKAKVQVTGLKRELTPMRGPAVQKPAANDAGDISWKLPMAKVYFPANIPNINFHHWAAGVCLATSIAHKGAAAGAKVVAASVLECLENPAVVAEAKRTFKDEIGGVPFASMLPKEQRPPLELNRALMEKYRPLLAQHYVKEYPNFV
jgi:aminobenzoyl-glutamate utilization protein B